MMIKMEKNMDLKNKYDSIIFDLDGTLWNSSKPICEAWNIILDRHKEIVREPITIEELGQCMDFLCMILRQSCFLMRRKK